jgi:hypothetical protein
MPLEAEWRREEEDGSIEKSVKSIDTNKLKGK